MNSFQSDLFGSFVDINNDEWEDVDVEDAEEKDREFRSAWGIKEDDFMIEMASPTKRFQKPERPSAKKEETNLK